MTPRKPATCGACLESGEFGPDWSILTVGPATFTSNPHKDPARVSLCCPCATIILSWIKVERADSKERA